MPFLAGARNSGQTSATFSSTTWHLLLPSTLPSGYPLRLVVPIALWLWSWLPIGLRCRPLEYRNWLVWDAFSCGIMSVWLAMPSTLPDPALQMQSWRSLQRAGSADELVVLSDEVIFQEPAQSNSLRFSSTDKWNL
ncbi:hypothetical protein C8J56DRAFT_1056114 [Mycena floridula]|nr:hypothetical protein C8J56DRAFT_1056114 [Mycena floridula]